MESLEHRGEVELRITCDTKFNDYNYQQMKKKQIKQKKLRQIVFFFVKKV